MGKDCRREAHSTHPKCKRTRKDRGFMPPEKSAASGDWSQRIWLCPLTLPAILQGHSLRSVLYWSPHPIQFLWLPPCLHGTHLYLLFLLLCLSLPTPTSSHLFLPSITSQIHFLHPDPRFRLCFQGKPNWRLHESFAHESDTYGQAYILFIFLIFGCTTVHTRS